MICSLRVVSCLIAATGLTVSATGKALTYEQLRAQIEQEKLYRVEQVLARLPDDLLRNFTMVYGSRSLQDSSLRAPRVLLFGRDAKLVITFNGEPEQKRFDELELLQWRDESAEFELRTIKFEGNGVQFSHKNPSLCLTCHGQSPHPIWGSYDYQKNDKEFWPGFYGSVHDAPKKVPAERDAFVEFRVRAPSHLRYRYLHFEDNGSKWYPYGEGAFQHRYRPNNRLGNLLSRLNARRIAQRAVKSQFLERNRDLVLKWILQCPGIEHSDFYARVYALFQRTFSQDEYAGIYAELEKAPSEFRLAFLFEKLLTGLDVYTWNMSIATEPVRGRFSTGIIGIDQMVAGALLPRLIGNDTRLAAHYRVWNNAQVYDTFRKGYYNSNVAPGGVGAVYDELAMHYDEALLKNACQELETVKISSTQTEPER